MKTLKVLLCFPLLFIFVFSLQAVQPVKDNLTKHTAYKEEKKLPFFNRLVMNVVIKSHVKYLKKYKKKKRKSTKEKQNKVKFGMWAWITFGASILITTIPAISVLGGLIGLGAVVLAIIGLNRDEETWLAKAFLIVYGALLILGLIVFVVWWNALF